MDGQLNYVKHVNKVVSGVSLKLSLEECVHS